MDQPTLHRRHFLLHLQERSGYDAPVLRKEPADEQPSRSHVDQLHNEYGITRQLADVAGVRPVYAKEGSESRPVLLMQYVEGHSLAELIRAGALDLAEKLRLAVHVTTVLSRIHGRQLMHKDLSSSNILVASGGAPGSEDGVYVIDFGAASVMQRESTSELAANEALVGTLAYISPEQTGRMNRSVDYRTDLYSLGVILYELLTGQLPFDSGDPLELIHDHIARPARPPHKIEPTIPEPVSDLVLRLLAKNAEERYQTAQGLLADLERCLDQWQQRGRIEPFPMGCDDFNGRVQIPEKLYGRQAEIERLQRILNRAFTAQAQLLLVAGYSGVGKTSLVREMHKDVVAKRGTYIEGKFDQLQRTRPYSAWEQAFTQLVDNWLARSEASLARWRNTILEAVGDHGQVLIDVIPGLERILGPQPEVPKLGGIENQNRIHHFFNRFLGCVATPEHPLLIFIDDLQWIDPASLDFLKSFFAGQSASRLLVIGAYRSNEVDAAHPLAVGRDRMQAETDRVTVIELEDLPAEDTHQLLADSLQMDVSDCRDLGQILVEKSAGNPFFFRQLLYALEAEGLLRFDRDQRRWMWDDTLGQNVQARGSVVDLLIGKIRTLPDATQHALSMAACMGSRFDTSTLHTVLGQPEADLLTALDPALQAGLILRSGGHHSFAHDRIQEAGYTLIPASDRPRIHLEIGRSLLARAQDEELKREIFTIVSHLNIGRNLIDTDSERIELATLNLTAGKRAKAASAYANAKTHVEVGLELLGTDPWQDQYHLTLSLHNEDGDLAFLTGQYDQVTATAALIHDNAKRILDRVHIYMTQIEAATAQSRHVEALDLGLAGLRELDMEISAQPTQAEGLRLRDKSMGLLTSKPMEQIQQLPRMSDERAMAASALIASMMSTAYIANPLLLPIISYHGVILTLEFGLDVWSPLFVGVAALVNAASITPDTPDDEALGLIKLNRQLVEVIQTLLENPITSSSRTKGLASLSFTTPWLETYEDSIGFSRAAYDSSHETGDWLHGSYGTTCFAVQSFAAGMKLSEYQRQLSAFADSLRMMGHVHSTTNLAVHLQTADNFVKPSPEPHRLRGVYFREDEWLSQAIAESNLSTRHRISVYRFMLAYHFDRDEALDDYAAEAKEFLIGGGCHLSVAQFYFYQALAKLRKVGSGNATHRPHILNPVGKNLRWMRHWAETNPSTFLHRYHLMAAERARVTGDSEEALSHYERAISGAQASGFTHEEALANELYGRFWAERGHDRFAGPLMREAHSLYRKWGALAKADQLAERYPKWLVKQQLSVPDAPTSLLGDDLKTADLDLRTILKASQDIASEIKLDSLLARLMTHVIENTGAQRGCLILEIDGRWMIEAKASVDELEPDGSAAEDIADSDLLAEGIVRYVARTQETVVLDDGFQSGKFVDLPYLQAHQVRSVLCMPLINRGTISAILYLENNLAPNVFSPDRVSLLQLLSSQMAISIDNARVHADLEELLELRSRALASAEVQIRTLFEESPLGIALSSSEGKVLSANKTMLKMLGITEEDLLERSVVDFYDDAKDRDAVLRGMQEEGFVQDFGVQLMRHDGSHFHANLNMSQLVLEGNEVLLAMVQDVTAQITAEQETAVLEERARLARELHDAVSQTILSASLLADATARTSKEGHAIETRDVTKLSGMLRGALDEMRTLLLEMRPTAMQDRTLGQLLAPLAEAARARSRTEVNLRIEGDRVLPENVTTHLQRIAQESLNNAIRHAEAKMVQIELVCDPEGVALRIADDGCGFDVERLPAGHHGLEIMRERAQEIGALLEVHSTIDQGTEVSVTWS